MMHGLVNVKFVPLYSCNNYITLMMAAVAAETCWREYSE